MHKLPVIFRASRTKDAEGHTITCYAHVGQHGGCDHQFIYRTRKARPEEYADLLTELRGIYGQKYHDDDHEYELIVYQRIQPSHRKAFDAEVRRHREYVSS